MGFLSLAEREDGLSYSGGSRDTEEGRYYLPFGYRNEINRGMDISKLVDEDTIY